MPVWRCKQSGQSAKSLIQFAPKIERLQFPRMAPQMKVVTLVDREFGESQRAVAGAASGYCDPERSVTVAP